GPEAQQLATYIGWLLHGVRGGLAAGLLFILPGALVMLGLSALYANFADVSFVSAIFYGVKAAVLAVVVEAIVRISRRALQSNAMMWIAAAAFVALFVFAVPFPLVVLTAGFVGFIGARFDPASFRVGNHGSATEKDAPAAIDRALDEG